MQLHILILSDRDWTHPQAGGTGANLYGQVSRWVAWGHRVSIVACGYPGAAAREEIGDITIHRIGGRSTVFPRTILAQARRRLVPDADVVLEVVNGITFLTPLWCRQPRMTIIHHIHREHYVREMGARGRLAALLLETVPLRLLYRRTRFVTISEDAAGDIAAHGIPRAHIHVSYLGVEHEAFGLDSSVRAERPTLLYLGRLKKYKRVELLLDVLESCPGAVLEIAGDGDHREPIEAAIRDRGLCERVRMHGHVSEEMKTALYQRAWVHLTASAAEGWGLNIIEAAACGTPSAALRIGGPTEAIVDDVTGVLADDIAELAAKTAALLADDARREALGRAAYDRACELTWDATARRTLELLDREHRARNPGAPPAYGLESRAPEAALAGAAS